MNWKIEYLDNYPKNGKHLKIVFSQKIPLRITKGEDGRLSQYWYIDYNYIRTICDTQSSNYWFKFDLPQNGFKIAEKAVEQALKIYKQWLQNQINQL